MDSDEQIQNTGSLKPERIEGNVKFDNVRFGYDPENRSDVRVRSNDNPTIALAFFGFIGGIFFIIGIAFLIGSIRNRNKPDPFEQARAQMEEMRAEMKGREPTRDCANGSKEWHVRFHLAVEGKGGT